MGITKQSTDKIIDTDLKSKLANTCEKENYNLVYKLSNTEIKNIINERMITIKDKLKLIKGFKNDFNDDIINRIESLYDTLCEMQRPVITLGQTSYSYNNGKNGAKPYRVEHNHNIIHDKNELLYMIIDLVSNRESMWDSQNLFINAYEIIENNNLELKKLEKKFLYILDNITSNNIRLNKNEYNKLKALEILLYQSNIDNLVIIINKSYDNTVEFVINKEEMNTIIKNIYKLL